MALAANSLVKSIVITLCLIILTASAKQTKEDNTVLKCVRWRWTGDVFERKVYCVEWIKKDCSQRLYKEICKQE